MLRVTITASDGFSGWVDFNTQDDADSYIADVTASQKWGTNDWVEIITPEIPAVAAVAAVLDDQGNVITPAIAAVSEVPAVTQDHPATWSYTVTDITVQYNLQQAIQQSLANQSVGATVVATVAAINESKLAAGTMSQQTFTALLADTNVANIERLLWNGSLVTAKALIQSVNLSAYYTSDEIASIVAMLP